MEILLDVRTLEAPLPLQRALSAAKALEVGQYIKMVHRMRPCHLFENLVKMGIWRQDFEVDTEEYFVFMARMGDESTIERIQGVMADEYGRTFA
jgi:TusA-related sulfurtransferase